MEAFSGKACTRASRLSRRDLDKDQYVATSGMAPARRKAPCQGSSRPLENPDLCGRLSAVEASMRRASSTVQSTAKVSRLMSNTCSLRCCAPATSLSWITSARTKAARSAAPFALLAPISCFCRRTRRTSIQSSRSSQNSRHFSEKPKSAPSMASGGASAVSSTPSLPENAPTTSKTQDMLLSKSEML